MAWCWPPTTSQPRATNMCGFQAAVGLAFPHARSWTVLPSSGIQHIGELDGVKVHYHMDGNGGEAGERVDLSGQCCPTLRRSRALAVCHAEAQLPLEGHRNVEAVEHLGMGLASSSRSRTAQPWPLGSSIGTHDASEAERRSESDRRKYCLYGCLCIRACLFGMPSIFYIGRGSGLLSLLLPHMRTDLMVRLRSGGGSRCVLPCLF